MSTRRIALAGVLATSAIVTSAAGPSPVALAAGAPKAAAQVQTCWDFATLDQSHLYRIGEIFVAPTATIEMKNYLLNGNKVTPDGAVGHARQSQVAGGQAIILGVACGTTGGYPHVAHVISADCDRLGQLGPGTPIALQRVTLDEARRIDRADREARARRSLGLSALARDDFSCGPILRPD